MTKYYQGKFKPRNPIKYRGDKSEIRYRSSWELKCMDYFDRHPGIVWWSSEELIIPYISPIDGRTHRYFPDFIFETINKERFVCEVKPHKQTIEPKPQKKKTKRYINEVYAWGVNKSKWEAAERFCAAKNAKFIILTEKHLGV